MSYILEALRRSQAERERGQVPGLHAQALPTGEAAPPLPRSRALLWLGLGLGGGLIAASSAWWWLAGKASPPARVPVAAAPVPVPASMPAPAPAPLPVVVSAPPPPVAAPVPPPAAATPPPPAPAPAAPPRALSLSELSPEQRRELPPMILGGSIWSENPQSRFVIVNGQVVREGEAAAAGVTVERIAPKSVVLRWRELRIELAL